MTGNQFLAVGRAVVFNAVGTGAISGVHISNNTVRTVAFPSLGPARAIDQATPPDSNWTYHHIISGLDISNNSFYDDDGKSDAVIRLSQLQGGIIQNNKMFSIPGAAFSLGSSPWGTSDVTFMNNTIGWIGSSGAPALILGFNGSSTNPPKPAYDASNIKILNNTVTRTVPGPSVCAVYADWKAGATITGIVVQGNTFTNIGSQKCGPMAAGITISP